mmetsp:Transcript_23144/g.64294  ORF Transcript_23144/g.64294 Transcript_23144/m.64294 type:complete len:224 (+) Transcript_23144:257-928(+)
MHAAVFRPSGTSWTAWQSPGNHRSAISHHHPALRHHRQAELHNQQGRQERRHGPPLWRSLCGRPNPPSSWREHPAAQILQPLVFNELADLVRRHPHKVIGSAGVGQGDVLLDVQDLYLAEKLRVTGRTGEMATGRVPNKVALGVPGGELHVTLCCGPYGLPVSVIHTWELPGLGLLVPDKQKQPAVQLPPDGPLVPLFIRLGGSAGGGPGLLHILRFLPFFLS